MKIRPSGLLGTAALLVLGIAVSPQPAGAGTGGPDAYGYTWIDSDEAGGPVFDATFQPPSATLGLCEQEWYTVSIGFVFEFYGATYTRAAISANGALYLTNGSLDTRLGGDNTNTCSATAVQNPRIAALWDD